MPVWSTRDGDCIRPRWADGPSSSGTTASRPTLSLAAGGGEGEGEKEGDGKGEGPLVLASGVDMPSDGRRADVRAGVRLSGACDSSARGTADEASPLPLSQPAGC